MAKQEGIIKLNGTIGDITFYKSKDGYLARTKGGVSAERIATDPAFARTRENGSEFGGAASSGKLLRTNLRPFLLKASDSRATSRLTQAMRRIIGLDTTNPRGQRDVATGLGATGADEILKNFNFNEISQLGSVLFSPIVVNTTTGEISIASLDPVNDIAAPSGATHVKFSVGFSKVDFSTGANELQLLAGTEIALDAAPAALTLAPPSAPAGAGTGFHVVLIEFFQEVNGLFYGLNNGSYNVLAILELS